MLLFNLLGGIIGTLSLKFSVGFYNFYRQLQERDYILIDHQSEHDLSSPNERFLEMKLSCEPSEEEHADPAFVSQIHLFWKSIQTGVLLMVAALFIFIANLIYLPLLHPCLVNPSKQRRDITLRLIYDLLSVTIMQLLFLLYCSVLSLFQKHKWKLIATHFIAVSIDIMYRVMLYINNQYPCSKQHCYLMSIVWFSAILISTSIIALNMEDTIKKRIQVFVIVPLQFAFNIVSLMVINEVIAPSFAGLPGTKQVLLTLSVMVPCFCLRTICRLGSQELKTVIPLSKIYILSMVYEINMKIEYRFLQAFIEQTSTYIITSLVQVLISFCERSSILLVNYFFMWLSRKCLNLKETHRITPFTRRLLTDVLLIGFLSETISAVLSITLILYGGYVRGVLINDSGRENSSLLLYLTVYGKRVGSNIVMELVFSILAIFLMVKYFKLPILTLWSKTWKEKTMLTLISTWFLLAYVGHDITSTAYLNAKYRNTFSSFNCTSRGLF